MPAHRRRRRRRRRRYSVVIEKEKKTPVKGSARTQREGHAQLDVAEVEHRHAAVELFDDVAVVGLGLAQRVQDVDDRQVGRAALHQAHVDARSLQTQT